MKRNWLIAVAALITTACNDTTSPADNNPPVDTIPVNLTIIGRASVPERITSEVAALGEWVYTGSWGGCRPVCGNAIKVWNASAATPVLVDSLIIPNAGTTGDVQISADGSLLVIANEYSPNGAISIFDRSNPGHPQLLTRFTSTDIAGGVHTVKLGTVSGRQYAFLSINNAGSQRARLVIVDITNPRAPVQVFAAVMGNPFVHDVFVRDGILFTALWDDGLTIWDIGGGGRGGSTSAPVQLGNVRTIDGDVHNIHWFHDPSSGLKRYAFVGQESPGNVMGPTSGDIHVVDVTNLSAPSEVAFFHVDSAGVHNFAVDEQSGILYAAYYNAGIRAIDIRGDLSNCTAVQRAADGRCNMGLMKRERGRVNFGQSVMIWGVAIVGNVLYASDMNSGLWKIDITPLKR
jgi:hypothetical protein